VNRLALRIFVDKYGELKSEKYNTTLNKEIEKFQLIDVLYHKSAEQAPSKKTV
jgi:hypothetical protein